MKRMVKKLMGAVLGASLLLSCLGTTLVSADEVAWPKGPSVEANGAIVMEASTGTILYEKNIDTQYYPASITKILTTLLAIENGNLSDTVTFGTTAVYENEGDSSHISRDVGEEMTLEQCLYAVMLESANECAYQVAEFIGGGDYQKFVDMMNEKATELGCTNTHFNNANGLPDENHVTTCRDMALIAKEAIKNQTFREICSTKSYKIPPTNKHDEITPLNNHHRMISTYKGLEYIYEYAIGGKTGYTVAAGNTLVTYAEKDGMLLICVLMNSPVTAFPDTISLFDYCFSHYSLYNISENEQRFNGQGAKNASLFYDTEAFAKLDTSAEIILPSNASFEDTETTVSYDAATPEMPGTLVYTYAGKVVGSADVYLTDANAATYSFGKIEESEYSSADEEILPNKSGNGFDLKELIENWEWNYKSILFLVICAAVIAFIIWLIIHIIQNPPRFGGRGGFGRGQKYVTIKPHRGWGKRR